MNTKMSILFFSSLFICAAQAAQASNCDLSQDSDLYSGQGQVPQLEHQPSLVTLAKGHFTKAKDYFKAAWANTKPETQEKINKCAAYGTQILAGYGLVSFGIDATNKALSVVESHAPKAAICVGFGFLLSRLWAAIGASNAQKERLEVQKKSKKGKNWDLLAQQINELRQKDSDEGYDAGRTYMKRPTVEPYFFTKTDKTALIELQKHSYVSDKLQMVLNAKSALKTVTVGLAGYAAWKLVPQVASLLTNNPKTAVLGVAAACAATAARTVWDSKKSANSQP